ncbi:MAG: VWA domain-containing protein [Chthoniobacterales bacterium]|nr:VWA domain-containing protein [Chthoniobacterales bacterium]
MPLRSVPVQAALPLNDETYEPRNNTALLDAIGQTIDELGKSLAALPEKDRPGQVIVAILTDGLENASRRYAWTDVADRIKQQTAGYKWTFLFLGANQDAIATAAQLNIAAGNSASYVADAAGSAASHAAFSRKARALRRNSMGIASQEETADAAAPMATILQEEDGKQRKSR